VKSGIAVNVDSFTFNSYELTTTNFFTPLSNLDSTFEYVTSACFSPIHTNSPRSTTNNSRQQQPHISYDTDQLPQQGKILSNMSHEECQFRLLTINCCGLRTNRSEFQAAVEYVKPDGICGTESWLKGVKPGKDPEKNAIKTSKYSQIIIQQTEMTD